MTIETPKNLYLIQVWSYGYMQVKVKIDKKDKKSSLVQLDINFGCINSAL